MALTSARMRSFTSRGARPSLADRIAMMPEGLAAGVKSPSPERVTVGDPAIVDPPRLVVSEALSLYALGLADAPPAAAPSPIELAAQIGDLLAVVALPPPVESDPEALPEAIDGPAVEDLAAALVAANDHAAPFAGNRDIGERPVDPDAVAAWIMAKDAETAEIAEPVAQDATSTGDALPAPPPAEPEAGLSTLDLSRRGSEKPVMPPPLPMPLPATDAATVTSATPTQAAGDQPGQMPTIVRNAPPPADRADARSSIWPGFVTGFAVAVAFGIGLYIFLGTA